MITVFWNVGQCSLADCNQRFGGMYGLHLHDVTCEMTVIFIVTAVKTSDLAGWKYSYLETTSALLNAHRVHT
jgi:hypothetical protein